MYLGLDLRGGVHFMLHVDMQAALNKKAESLAGDLRTVLREKNVRHGGISRNGQAIELRLRDTATLNAARAVLLEQFAESIELARSTEDEKQSQLSRLADFHTRHAAEAPVQLARLQQAVIENQNVFNVLMDAVRCCSLGQITSALFEVGGQYRRSM
jgi:preprotein translocase subunit SecD